MVDKALFLLGEGVKNLWRHRITALTAIGSIFLTLFLIGGLLLVGQQTQKMIVYLRSKYKIEVFFADSVSEKQAVSLLKQIKTIPGVFSTTLISKEDAVKIFRSQFGEDILDLLDYNPLPISCVVNVAREGQSSLNIDAIIAQIKEIKGVDTVRYQGHLIRKIELAYQRFFKAVILGSILILLVTVMIISNTIKLTIYAKADLIRALKLVGATRLFIKMPFIIEGLLMAILGSALAVGGLWVSVLVTNGFLTRYTAFQLEMNWMLWVWLLLIAMAISILGSSRATTKFLRQ
ncbi:MAG: cell division protein FtsX [Fidelibacterota bacterium]